MTPKVGFIKKKVRSLTLGERIVKTRNERGFALEKVSQDTGIQVKYLEAIEKGDMNELPATVYVHGFLRLYARYLGENEERFIVLFDRERGIAKKLSPKDNDEEQSKNLWSSPKPLVSRAITPSFFVSFFFILLFFACVWYIYSGLSEFVSEPQIFLSSPENGVIIRESAVLLEGKTDSNAELFVNERKILVDESGNFSERIEIRQGLNTLILRSKNIFEKETEKIITVVGEWEDLPKNVSDQEESIEILQIPFTLENRSKGPLNIEIAFDDGQETEKYVFEKGEKREFFGKERVVISSSSGKNTFVSIGDGESKALSLSSGKVLEKEIFLLTKEGE